jgi:hypothetical protein
MEEEGKKKSSPRKKKKKIKSSYNAELCILRPSEGECGLQSQVVKKQRDREGTKKKQCKKTLDAQLVSHCSALQYRTESAP